MQITENLIVLVPFYIYIKLKNIKIKLNIDEHYFSIMLLALDNFDIVDFFDWMHARKQLN
jgi:hypothetical protein